MENLKALREQKKISQQKLADELGTSQQLINNYENNKNEPDLFMLKKMAVYFNTSIDYLVGPSAYSSRVEDYSSDQVQASELAHLGQYRKLPQNIKDSIDNLINNILTD